MNMKQKKALGKVKLYHEKKNDIKLCGFPYQIALLAAQTVQFA